MPHFVASWDEAALGLTAQQVMGREFFGLPLRELPKRARAPFDAAVHDGHAEEVTDVPYTLPGGEARLATLRFLPMRTGNGELTGVTALLLGRDRGASG